MALPWERHLRRPARSRWEGGDPVPDDDTPRTVPVRVDPVRFVATVRAMPAANGWGYCDACGGPRFVGDGRPGPHAPRYVRRAGGLVKVDCIGRVLS